MSRTRIPSICTLLLLSSMVPAIGAQPAPATTYPSDPYIITPPATTSVKLGSAATFTVVAWSAKTLKYQWYKNSQLINGANAAKYTTPATSASDNGSGFYVQVSNGTSSLNSNTAQLWVDASIPTIEQQPASQTVQAPGVAMFQAYAYDGNNDVTAQWYKNGSAVGSVQPYGYATYNVTETTTADNGAKFTVKFTNGAGSITSNPAVLTVKPANITGTYPIVGEWTGTATITNPDKTVTKVQALAAFSQNSYSLTATVVYTDDSGIPVYSVGVASLNNLNVYIGVAEGANIAAGFSTDLLTLTGFGGGYGDPNEADSGSGKIVISADHNALTGTGTLSDGTSISFNMTRAK